MPLLDHQHEVSGYGNLVDLPIDNALEKSQLGCLYGRWRQIYPKELQNPFPVFFLRPYVALDWISWTFLFVSLLFIDIGISDLLIYSRFRVAPVLVASEALHGFNLKNGNMTIVFERSKQMTCKIRPHAH
jgi:hypothetical protein